MKIYYYIAISKDLKDGSKIEVKEIKKSNKPKDGDEKNAEIN